jgi:hypothetical protein
MPTPKIYKLSKLHKLIAFVVTFLYASKPASAQQFDWGGVCVGGPDSDVATLQGLECLVANIFNVAITLIGLAAFVMLVVGSIRWLMSGGNSSALDKARSTMTYALIGIVVALSGFIVLNLIAGFTGVDMILDFSIPRSN